MDEPLLTTTTTETIQTMAMYYRERRSAYRKAYAQRPEVILRAQEMKRKREEYMDNLIQQYKRRG